MLMTDEEKTLWATKGHYGAKSKCDLAACGRPISFLAYKGRDGEYCSNNCLEASLGIRGGTRPSTPAEKGKAETLMAKAKTKTKTVKAKTAAAGGSGGGTATATAAKPAKAEKVAGKYRPGSSMAIYLERLSDEQPHTLDELSDGLSIKYPKDPPFYLEQYGRQEKLWSITKDKEAGTYTMALTVKGRKLLARA